jgi:hypothetical protein
MSEVILMLVVPPELEETVIDWLLAREEISGFTGQTVYGHSREHGGFSLVEQVTGRQRRVMFQVQTDETTARALLAALGGDLSGAGIRYWVVPVVAAGRFG